MPSPSPPGGGISSGIIESLDTVLPPVLTEVVASSLVVFEALLEAMASSGQALVIPLIAGAIGLFAPGLRRRERVEDVLDD